MTAYVAPLADMRFVMRQIANMKAVRALPGYSDVTDDLVDAILEGAGRLAAEVLAPLNATGDRQGCILANGVVRVPEGFVDAYRQFVAGGWNSIALPSEYGGQGLLCLVTTAVGEIWNAANLAFAVCPILTQAAAELLLHHGDRRMRAEYLPKLASGEWTGTMLLTEEQAGWTLRACAPGRCPRATTSVSSDRRSSSPTASTTWRRTSSTPSWPVPRTHPRAARVFHYSCAQVPGEGGRPAWTAQRCALRVDREQDGHQGYPDRDDVSR